MYKKHNANYHSHTYLCGHAGGVPDDYLEIAINKNYKELGISEHGPMPNMENNNSRLKFEDYDTYFKLLEEAKIKAANHGIKLYKGFEIEYLNFLNVYEKYLKDVDYLILGQHFILRDNKLRSTYGFEDLEDVIIYKDTIIEAVKTGYFNMIAHPALCFYNIPNPTDEMYKVLEEIIDVAIEYDIPIELNANGMRRSVNEDKNIELDYNKFKYPSYRFFKEVGKKQAKVLVSGDAHSPDAVDDWAIEESYKFAKELNLNLIYNLDMNYNKRNKN